jgi:biotin carboxyl carrier protein
MRENEKLSRIALEAGTYETLLTRKFALRKPYQKKDLHLIKALIPGVIEKIATTVGATVRQGDILIIQEAMKMHNRIRAPHDGRIKVIAVAAGEKVGKGQLLLEME